MCPLAHSCGGEGGAWLSHCFSLWIRLMTPYVPFPGVPCTGADVNNQGRSGRESRRGGKAEGRVCDRAWVVWPVTLPPPSAGPWHDVETITARPTTQAAADCELWINANDTNMYTVTRKRNSSSSRHGVVRVMLYIFIIESYTKYKYRHAYRLQGHKTKMRKN